MRGYFKMVTFSSRERTLVIFLIIVASERPCEPFSPLHSK